MPIAPMKPHDEVRNKLSPTLVAEPLRSKLNEDPKTPRHIIIDLNIRFSGGIEAARKQVFNDLKQFGDTSTRRNQPAQQHPYVFAELSGEQLDTLMKTDFEHARSLQANLAADRRRPDSSVPRECRAIFKIWESAQIRPLTTVSIRTVKADAAQSAFAAKGEGIVWAVLDSGISPHSHFRKYKNLELDSPLEHRNFASTELDPLKDGFGHGTHVAGIIAGTLDDEPAESGDPELNNAGSARLPTFPTPTHYAAQQSVDPTGKNTEYHLVRVPRICGMAPMCKLMSARVLDDAGVGDVTAVINALEWIIQLNGDGSKPLVHGVNISAGYLPDPENYGSGQSPICRQVNRAVKSGLVVVVAAGNFGYSTYQAVQSANALVPWDAGVFASVADPGNADLAITVGATHREEPHRYGISYFSSKGPTADGRLKPDVVAPGERILSCAAGAAKAQLNVGHSAREAGAGSTQAALPDFEYIEDSGTSMAAPHVSGVVAAFLSIRHEFIGEPEEIAQLIASSAMDLKREPRLQGAGLIDLFKMLQSV
jgi:serine protease AprX